MSDCVQPISWLLLERYHLGEVSATERERVDAHLNDCERCRGDLQTIHEDERPIPALPEIRIRSARRDWFVVAAPIAGMALVLFAVLFAIHQWRLTELQTLPPGQITTKGGDVAIHLVRDRAGTIVDDPRGYLDGDRFQVQLTCPPGDSRYEVVVYQDGQAFFPYPADIPLSCGNRNPLPGAFRLTGTGSVVVCASFGDDLPSRDLIRIRDISALGASTVCASLASVAE